MKTSKKLGQNLVNLVGEAVNTFGSFNPEEIECLYVEKLTVNQYNKITPFLHWVNNDSEKRAFGSDNIQERYQEFLTSPKEENKKSTKKESTKTKALEVVKEEKIKLGGKTITVQTIEASTPATPAKADKKKVGVIASIQEFVTKAKKGLTHEDILVKLVNRFPDRAKTSMYKTIKAQLGANQAKACRMEREKNITFTKLINDHGCITFMLSK